MEYKIKKWFIASLLWRQAGQAKEAFYLFFVSEVFRIIINYLLFSCWLQKALLQKEDTKFNTSFANVTGIQVLLQNF